MIWFAVKHVAVASYVCCLKAQHANPCQPWRMGSDLGLHGFLRSLPGTDPRNWCVCWRLWIQGVDRFWPSWENQEAQCWNRQRKTCDDGYHRYVFPGGDGVLCADCLLRLSKTRNSAKIVAERAQSAPERITSQCQFAWHVLSSWNVCSARPAFSTQQVWLINVSFLLLYIHASLPMRWALACAGNEQFHDDNAQIVEAMQCCQCMTKIMPCADFIFIFSPHCIHIACAYMSYRTKVTLYLMSTHVSLYHLSYHDFEE